MARRHGRGVLLAVLWYCVVAERSGDGDVQVLMQRPPVKAGDVNNAGAAQLSSVRAAEVEAMPGLEPEAWPLSFRLRWAAGLLGLLGLLILLGESRKESSSPSPESEVFQEDLRDLTTAWERSASLWQALFYFCYCRHLRSNIYGITLALSALASNVAFVVLAFLEPSTRHWNESLRILLASSALLAATSVESIMRTRYAAEASRTAAVALGLVAAKVRRVQTSSSAEELLQDADRLQEAFAGLFQVAVLPLQVLPVFIWLWTQLGGWTLLLLLAGAPLVFTSSSPSTVEAFLVYEKASRQRWDLLAASATVGQAEAARELRKQALDALQVIHYQSHSRALCLSRFVQLLALGLLLLSSRLVATPTEVLLVIFFQCHYVLRHLSTLTVVRSPLDGIRQRWEAILRQEEVEVAEVDGEVCLEMVGCFDWSSGTSEQEAELALPCLSNVDLQVRRGELVAIVGTAGAGKTSLLRAACGCLTPGNCSRLKRSSSWIFSDPWLFEGSLRQNVLCGRPFDEGRYRKTLEACGLDETDVAAVGSQTQRIALARAAYGREALVVLDDPFAGFSNQEVDELFEIFHSELFADRCCLVSFGTSAPQRQLLRPKPGLRFILMEAGNMQVVGQLPEYLNNEAFCCRSATTTASSVKASDELQAPSSVPASGVDPAWALVTGHRAWLAALVLDQLVQLSIDWWILLLCLAALPWTVLGTSMMLAALVLHLGSKLLLARLGASSYAANGGAVCGSEPRMEAERRMDLKMPGQLWGRVAGSCTFLGLLGLSHLQLAATASPLQLLAVIPIYLWALKALPGAASTGAAELSPKAPLLTSLRRSVELGPAVKERFFERHQEQLIAQRDCRPPRISAMLMHLGPCVAAAYGLTALVLLANNASSTQTLLTLAPFGLLLQFVTSWTDSLKDD